MAQGPGKSGPGVACWFKSGVASLEGETSTAAGVRWAGQGQGQPSWARSGQPREQETGHHHLSAATNFEWIDLLVEILMLLT